MDVIFGFVVMALIVAFYLLFVQANKTALLVIDMQDDFLLLGRALAVKGGESIVTTINKWINLFLYNNRLIVYSRDWHPKKTRHFKCEENPKGWDEHCVADTPGAQFHRHLIVADTGNILSKGMGQEDAYSAFDNAARIKGMDLHRFFRINRVKTLFVCGVATDFCVRATVMDALGLGYKVILLVDAMKGVNLNPGDHEKAIAEMVAHGAKVYSEN